LLKLPISGLPLTRRIGTSSCLRKDGILEVHLPKTHKTERRQVEIA
jgi:HSP20 family molecular chaperone IbpA